ncbi:ABC transporter permease, amino acid [Neisseria gonorrhoeae]|nr:ABC transporter permease, amino acid [Neisseria gonorrhoeae]
MKNRFTPAALIYLLMTTFLGWIFLRLEKRYNPQHR